jgi:PE family
MVTAAELAAAFPTTSVMAAGGDEVSATKPLTELYEMIVEHVTPR